MSNARKIKSQIGPSLGPISDLSNAFTSLDRPTSDMADALSLSVKTPGNSIDQGPGSLLEIERQFRELQSRSSKGPNSRFIRVSTPQTPVSPYINAGPSMEAMAKEMREARRARSHVFDPATDHECNGYTQSIGDDFLRTMQSGQAPDDALISRFQHAAIKTRFLFPQSPDHRRWATGEIDAVSMRCVEDKLEFRRETLHFAKIVKDKSVPMEADYFDPITGQRKHLNNTGKSRTEQIEYHALMLPAHGPHPLKGECVYDQSTGEKLGEISMIRTDGIIQDGIYPVYIKKGKKTMMKVMAKMIVVRYNDDAFPEELRGLITQTSLIVWCESK